MAGDLQEGIEFFRTKRWSKALKEFKSLKPSDLESGEKEELSYYLGLCFMKLNQYEDALLHLEQVVTGGSNPLRIYQCRMTLAYIYVITGRSKMAEFELRRLLAAGFKSAQLYSTLGYASWSQKRYKEAVDYYEKALEVDGENPTALNCLGYILVDTNADISRGLRYCRKAVDRKPQNPAYLDSLGWAYFKNGETQEARVWLRRALEAAPHEQEIKKHMRTVVGDVE
ncbi:MAG: tetratricopeptide repeat protein [Spirochaetaceae bacterium]|jgi:tetratricopeptide (TPR) repeat protein|nr:tetratricopeptide repeat protein [Spirochaetaceae bacterium]